MSVTLDLFEYSTDLAARVYETDAASVNVLTGGTASADSEASGSYAASNAVNNNTTDRWTTTNTVFPHWWKYDLGAGNAKACNTLEISKYHDADHGIIKDFTVAGSNDDSSYTTLFTGQASDEHVELAPQTFTFSNATAYRFYKINVTSNYRADNYVGFYEVKLYETPAIQVSSESTIKEQGSYSLKGYANTSALNKVIRRSISGSSVWSKTLADYYIDGNTKYNIREVLSAANISASGTAVRIKLTGHSANDLNITAVSIGERSGSTGSFAATPTRVTFKNGSTTVLLKAGETLYSDWIAFSLDESKDYLVAFALTTDTDQSTARVISTDGHYSHITTSDETLTVDGSSYSSSNTYIVLISGLEVDSSFIDLSGLNTATFRIRSSRTGSNLKVGIKDIGGTTTEATVNVSAADTWQDGAIDLSGVSDANKNAICAIIITVLNADSANTFYLDDFASSDSVTVSATTDVLSLDEYAATISIDTVINSTCDALTVTGNAATVDFTGNFNATCANLTLTENAATVVVSLGINTLCDGLTLTEHKSIIEAVSPAINTGWLANKGACHEWIDSFVEQPNKWGYLNNPNWVHNPTDPVNYTGDEDNEPVVWEMDHRRF